MKHDNDVFDRKGLGALIAERLVAADTCFVPLMNNEDELQLMADWDLASCITFRFGEDIDPEVLRDSKVRNHWLGLAVDEGERFGHYFELGRRPFWIVQDGERIGSVHFSLRDLSHEVTLELSSVYVRPKHRRQGWASRMLRGIKDTAFAAGVDRMFLSCHWGNQDALRFYLAQGMWVQFWKHDIRLFIDKGAPTVRLAVDGSRATFFVEDRVVGIADNHGVPRSRCSTPVATRSAPAPSRGLRREQRSLEADGGSIPRCMRY